MKRTCLTLAIAVAGTMGAQTPANEPGVKTRTMHWESSLAVAGAPQEATIGFIAADGASGFAGSPLKGAPYSATIENSFTQTLADGTRIERKSSSKTARDSEGRTRTEHTPAAMAPVPVELPTTTIIHDPVAKQTIILNDKEKTARVMKMPDMGMLRSKIEGMGPKAGIRMRTAHPDGAAIAGVAPTEDVVIERRLESGGEVAVGSVTAIASAPGDAVFTTAVPAMPAMPVGAGMGQRVMMFSSRSGADKPESLGKQTVSGVSCDATRNRHTIPAGQIGNDRPIEIITETCFSDELKTVLSSRTIDPMHGETTMRLSGVNRSEPAKSLFEVPPGYTTKEGPQPMMFETKIDRKPAQ